MTDSEFYKHGYCPMCDSRNVATTLRGGITTNEKSGNTYTCDDCGASGKVSDIPARSDWNEVWTYVPKISKNYEKNT